MRTWTLIPFAALLAGCPAEPDFNDQPPPDVEGDATLNVCAAGNGELTESWAVDNGHGAVSALAVSESGDVALAGEDLTIKLWNVETQELSWEAPSVGGAYGSEFGAGTPLNALGFDGSGEWIVGGDDEGTVTAWSRETGLAAHTWPMSQQPITAAAGSWDGEWFAAASREFGGELRSWFSASGPDSFALDTQLWFVNAIEPLHDADQWIVAGDVYGEPAFELRSMSFPSAVLAHGVARGEVGTVTTAAMVGATVLVAGPGFVASFDVDDQAQEAALTEFVPLDHDVVSVVALDEQSFALATADGEVVLGQLDGLTFEARLQTAEIAQMALVPGAWQLATAGPDGVLRLLRCAL